MNSMHAAPPLQRSLSWRSGWLLFLFMAAFALSSGSAHAQSGLREALEALDIDGDGDVEPEELTSLSRPYLERITRARRMSMNRDMPIEQLLEAARVYHALQNGVAGRDVRPESTATLRGFGVDEGQPLVPEFGLAQMRYRYTEDDLREADRTLRRADRNNDGFVDREEARRSPWTHRNPFEMDLNRDDKLSRLELAQRYARRRLLQGAATELVQKARRTGSEAYKSRTERDRRGEDESRWSRRGGKSYWLTASLLVRFDENRNGRLDRGEAEGLGLRFNELDIDRDGEVSRDELFAYINEIQSALGEGDGIPGWFYERDANKDGQVAMSEFTDEWSEEKFAEFARLDVNDDGLLTADEISSSNAMVGGNYRMQIAQVLPPGKTVISEIEVTDSFDIRDLNVELSLTHTSVSQLDGFLTGPDGTNIELFTAVGGSGDNFHRTIFDDQAEKQIVKSQAPFEGPHIPEGALKRQPSLSSFNDKNVQGVWQLSIRGTRSERFGMLHHWSLHVKPKETEGSSPADATVEPAVPPSDGASVDSSSRPAG